MKPQIDYAPDDSDAPAQALNAKALRDLPEDAPLPLLPRRPLYIILDNVYDTYNIGGIFRLSDALAISKLYLCGSSETPPNARIKKASIGTYKVVPWEYHATTVEAIEALRRDVPDVQIIAVEQSQTSVAYMDYQYTAPLALVLGNETYGVSPEVLDACDAVVDIPMAGYNVSLNVIVSGAIVAYHAQAQLDFTA